MPGYKVLIVDDEEDFTAALAKRMGARGLTVDTAVSGEDALKKAKKADFDVIVLDLAMGGIDGIETLKRLKDKEPDLQIILLTGHATIETGVEAMKLGAVDYLQKPAEFADLLKKIEEAGAKRMLLVEQQREEQIAEILKTKGW